MTGKHILILGRRHVGKSTLIEKLLDEINVPVYGFYTRSDGSYESGYHSIYIYPAKSKERSQEDWNHIGDCNGRGRQIFPEVFRTKGIEYLEAKPDGIIAMDEIGFMEEQAPEFCRRVLECLDGDIPVIATVKTKTDCDFLGRVKEHPKAQVYEITEENRDGLYDVLLPVMKAWEKGLQR